MNASTTSPHELWNATCERLRAQMSQEMYEAYIPRLTASSWSANQLVLVTDDEVAAEVVKKNYLGMMERAVHELVGHPSLVRIGAASPEAADNDLPEPVAQLTLFGDTVAPPVPHRPRRPIAQRPTTPAGTLEERAREAELSVHLTLDDYVRGTANQLAVGAAEMIVHSDTFAYNPLVLVGDVGVGKTHLMNAIGLELLKSRPGLRVRMVTAERFTNGLQDALQTNRRQEFRRTYREDLDVLFVDDVQFLRGKKATLEEFYHTFNAVQHNRLVVLTCDQSPFQLEGFDDRLKSRLCNGMIADIKPPDEEMRRAFVHRVASRHGMLIPEDVATHIVTSVDGTFRALSGVLRNVLFRAHGRRHRSIDRGLVDAVIESLHVPTRAQGVDETTVLHAVAEVFAVRQEEILSRSRTRRISLPRQVAMHLLRTHNDLSYPQLGHLFKRDHSTVISNCARVQTLIDEGDEALAARIAQIERRLGLR